MSDFPTHGTRVRIITKDDDVYEFQRPAEDDEAIQVYTQLSAAKAQPRMILLDAAGQEIPAMKAHPEWEVGRGDIHPSEGTYPG